MIDYIVVLIIVASLGLILARSVKKRRAGQSLGCGCSCDNCTSSCHGNESSKINRD